MRQFRQGDVYLREVQCTETSDGKKYLRNVTLSELPKDNNRVILAYGEVTGHTHAFAPTAKVKLYQDPNTGSGLIGLLERDTQRTRPVSVQELTRDPTLRRFLEVKEEGGADLLHEEHSTIRIPKGLYEVIIQREYHPERVRQVED